MAAKRIDSKSVPREEYAPRRRNALERLAAMDRELAAKAYDPALVLAVQSAIAACDAFTIFHRGERSASDRHQDALELLSRVPGIRGLEEARKHLVRLLREKARIEYSGEPPKPKEAEVLVDHARRFVDFVERHLPEERP